MSGTGYLKDFEERGPDPDISIDTCRLGKIMEGGDVRFCHLSKGHTERYHEAIYRRSAVRWEVEE
jgi:hypothetical protein